MDKTYNPSHFEPIIREKWEKDHAFEVNPNSDKEPYCIIFPPPNANGSLHVGHAMYVYQDIMCRYARQMGKETFWLAGTDHAGIETQFVFEKHLAKQGKSRFQFDQSTLYKMIEEFVAASQGTMKTQLKSLGFSLDWSRECYTLDPHIVTIVNGTFKKLFEDGYVYRADRLVNYCCKDGTGFSDLEVNSEDVQGILYHISYGDITVATTRPETMLGDVAVMVNPLDARYKDKIGKDVTLPLVGRKIPIIADKQVEMEFGTGAVKVTPSHDQSDFEVAARHNLPHIQVIGFDGKIFGTGTEFDGLKVKAAREAVVSKLKGLGILVKEEPHQMVVKKCYKCNSPLEPLPKKQWYIRVKPLAQAAIKAIESGETQIHPARFTDILKRYLDEFIDWNVSRQIVWGIRIPAYKCTTKGPVVRGQGSEKSINENQVNYADNCRLTTDDYEQWFVSLEKPDKCQICGECEPAQDTDTFDTWFSSGQWPFATLIKIASKQWSVDSKQLLNSTVNKSDLSANYDKALQNALNFFNRFYPTTVMETGYDIARAWVARMMMLGIYATEKSPFKHIYFHGLVRDAKGQKMSKSKGNVVDPLKLTAQYGTDALRGALVFGTTPGADLSISEEKVRGMRNFVNKLWNIGRFIKSLDSPPRVLGAGEERSMSDIIKDLDSEFATLKTSYHKNLNGFEFSQALVDLHEFAWHRFADFYIEALKDGAKSGNSEVRQKIESIYLEIVSMLSPYMPFVTEAINMSFSNKVDHER